MPQRMGLYNRMDGKAQYYFLEQMRRNDIVLIHLPKIERLILQEVHEESNEVEGD